MSEQPGCAYLPLDFHAYVRVISDSSVLRAVAGTRIGVAIQRDGIQGERC